MSSPSFDQYTEDAIFVIISGMSLRFVLFEMLSTTTKLISCNEKTHTVCRIDGSSY